MSLTQHFELLAAYNQRMNAKFYASASQLSAAELAQEPGAFLGSILGTLNHIVVGDTLWLKRFATHPASMTVLRDVIALPAPHRLDQILFSDFAALATHRQSLDQTINAWVAVLDDSHLDDLISYRTTQGISAKRRYASLVLHFFSHQVHHRGQVSTLLTQAGHDVGDTDLLELIPDEGLV